MMVGAVDSNLLFLVELLQNCPQIKVAAHLTQCVHLRYCYLLSNLVRYQWRMVPPVASKSFWTPYCHHDCFLQTAHFLTFLESRYPLAAQAKAEELKRHQLLVRKWEFSQMLEPALA
jgi:hypothetical protein